MHPDPLAVADSNPGGFLTAVLEGEQTEERQLGDTITVRGRDTDHAALFFWMVIVVSPANRSDVDWH